MKKSKRWTRTIGRAGLRFRSARRCRKSESETCRCLRAGGPLPQGRQTRASQQPPHYCVCSLSRRGTGKCGRVFRFFENVVIAPDAARSAAWGCFTAHETHEKTRNFQSETSTVPWLLDRRRSYSSLG